MKSSWNKLLSYATRPISARAADRSARAHAGVLFAEPSAVYLPVSQGPARFPSRPRLARQADFHRKFDYTTLFNDIFRGKDGNIYAVSPPAEHAKIYEDLHFFCGETEKRIEFDVRSFPGGMGNVSLFRLKASRRVASLKIKAGGSSFLKSIAPRAEKLFSGSKCVFTVQKNNDLSWVGDWAEFYQTAHGANAFLLYDNSSDEYDVGDLGRAIYERTGARVLVVTWPFPYGPQLDYRWAAAQDSSFAQPAAIVDALFRFLGSCESVLNVDIDELIVPSRPDDQGSCLDLPGYAEFERFDYHTISLPPSHGNHYAYLGDEPRARPRKWMVRPSTVDFEAVGLDVHKIHGLDQNANSDGRFRAIHCVNLTSGWKDRGRLNVVSELANATVDENLRSYLDRVFQHRGAREEQSARDVSREMAEFLIAKDRSEVQHPAVSDVVDGVKEELKDRERYAEMFQDGGRGIVGYASSERPNVERLIRVLKLRGHRFSAEDIDEAVAIIQNRFPEYSKKIYDILGR